MKAAKLIVVRDRGVSEPEGDFVRVAGDFQVESALAIGSYRRVEVELVERDGALATVNRDGKIIRPQQKSPGFQALSIVQDEDGRRERFGGRLIAGAGNLDHLWLGRRLWSHGLSYCRRRLPLYDLGIPLLGFMRLIVEKTIVGKKVRVITGTGVMATKVIARKWMRGKRAAEVGRTCVVGRSRETTVYCHAAALRQ